MRDALIKPTERVTIIGAGDASRRQISEALKVAPVLVAADGGASNALDAGYTPVAVFGDLDSLPEDARDQLPDGTLHGIYNQDTTDFDKCLQSVDASGFIAVGVSSPRLDHCLAAFNSLVCNPQKRIVLLSGSDIVFLAPTRIEMRLPVGTRVSLFPMAEVTGRSAGLRWSIAGLRFAPDGRIGTSNVTESAATTLEFDNRGMLVILPSKHLGEAVFSLENAILWPSA